MTLPAAVSAGSGCSPLEQHAACGREAGLAGEPTCPLSNTQGWLVLLVLKCYLLHFYMQQFLLGKDYKDFFYFIYLFLKMLIKFQCLISSSVMLSQF